MFNPVIESSYYVRSSIAKLWSQYYQYGYWKVYVNQLHKAVTSVRQLVPFGLVLYTVFSVLFSAFLAFAEPRLILLIWIPLFAYLLLIVSTSFSKSTKQKVNFLILVQSFLTLHFSYGLGYSKGIFDFVVRRKKPSQNASKLTR